MKDVAYIIKGKVRKKVLLSLKEKPKTATMISKDLNVHRSSISRSLLDLKNEGYARCENPDDDKYRFYKITSKGLKLSEKMEGYK